MLIASLTNGPLGEDGPPANTGRFRFQVLSVNTHSLGVAQGGTLSKHAARFGLISRRALAHGYRRNRTLARGG